ncbi:MAG: PadR family transcriptional regulator [Acidobacteria bacterium]|nr:PadR family transcriptional regulator [Acidobacteriota bacterium]
MSKPKTLGRLEEKLLLALLHVGGESYAVPLAELVEHRTGREVSPASSYIVLRRLERAGLLESRVGDPRPEPGGRARRYFAITPRAEAMLRTVRQESLSMWRGLESRLEK